MFFYSTLQIQVEHCTGKIDFPTTPPSEEDKVWTITKTSTALKIDCNDVEVLSLVYSDYSEECVIAWRNEVDQIMFYPGSDTASDEYKLTGAEGLFRNYLSNTVKLAILYYV